MSIKEQTLTFAAICQVAHLVQQQSRSGELNAEQLATLLNSIMITSPENTLDVYGGDVQNLSTGLRLILEHLGNKSTAKDPEFTRYIVGLITLERKLVKKAQAMTILGQRIEQVNRQLNHFAIDSETVIASLASIYSDVISPLGARIQVAGDPAILKQPAVQNKIRALLLAGIRATVLWRQVGGKRRKILFKRSSMLECAQQLLNQY